MEPTAPLPITGNAKLDHYLAIAGIVLTLASTSATFMNAKIRAVLDSGDPEVEVPPLFLYIGLALNYLALNVDKAAQLHKLLRGHTVKIITINKPHEKKPDA